MHWWVWFILGFVVALGVVAWVLPSVRGKNDPSTPKASPGLPDDLISHQAREKAEKLGKIKGLFARQTKVANDDVQTLLGVSDATATRYLDELEKQGIIRQVGQTGKHVYYEKI